jgi:hypothetical protein
VKNIAAQRYVLRLVPLMLIYVVTVLAVSWWFRAGGPQGWLRYPVAVLPALPIIGVIVVMARFIVEQKDEYLRLVMVRQTLFAIGFTLVVSTVWGFLETYGLVPHVPAYGVFMLFCLGLLPGPLFNWSKR